MFNIAQKPVSRNSSTGSKNIIFVCLMTADRNGITMELRQVPNY